LIFNINHFDTNAFQSLIPLPVATTYSNIKLFNTGTFDDVWVENYVRSYAEILALDFFSQPIWTVRTLFLAHFNNNLQGGNIISLPNPIDKWIILRRGKNDAKFTKIAEVDANVDTYVDRFARSKEEYVYQLIAMAGDSLSEPLVADAVETNFTKVTLIDPVDNIGYEFCYDMSMSEIGVEEDLIISDTKGKFQTFLKGNKEVSVGSISMIATSDSITSDEINQDLEFLNGLKAFILNGKSKIIKFPKGMMYRVYTSDFSMTRKDGVDSYGNQIYRVGFEWREVGEV
jgi:hypothetical protein